MSRSLSNTDLKMLSHFIEAHMALHFPENRWNDLERNIANAADQFGYSDVKKFIDKIVSTPLSRENTELLASHLTVNETFFWREPQTFEALERVILPEIIERKSNSGKSIKIWSAGCSGGEEPYSIAIALSRFIPNIKDWKIQILATDISPVMLNKAEKGVYSKWSFRGTPAWLKSNYFTLISENRFEISDKIKKMVSFSYLNLAGQCYPSPVNNTNAFDIIYCRNVLMYFNQDRFKRVTKNLHNALLYNGYLIVSANELSSQTFDDFEFVNVPGFTLYKKVHKRSKKNTLVTEIDISALKQNVLSVELDVQEIQEEEIATPVVERVNGSNPVVVDEDKEINNMFMSGNYQEVITTLSNKNKTAEDYILLVKSHANLGDLVSAASVCESAISESKLDYRLHFIYSKILQNQGRNTDATSSLKRAIFLNPDFVLAYYSLGNILIKTGNNNGAVKNYNNALFTMNKFNDADIVPESEGLSVGRLKEIVSTSIQKYTVV